MAKTEYHRITRANHSEQCAWCSERIQGESFTITFPDKNQSIFHVECLYQFREVMAPWGSQQNPAS